MTVSQYAPDVIKYKPKMEMLPSPDSANWLKASVVIHGETVIMVKADGEFNVLEYNRGGDTFTTNKYGRQETPRTLQAIADAEKIMAKDKSIKSAKFKVEMYINYDGKLMRVNDFIHYLKGKNHIELTCKEKGCYGKTVNEIRGRIALGAFDLIELNGKKINESQVWKLEEMERMLGKTKGRFHVLPWQYVGVVSPSTVRKEIVAAWAKYKEKQGWEGLVVYADSIFKVKNEYEIDAVIVGLNKNDGYSKKQGTSVKLAVVKDKNQFVEIGDVASGISLKMRSFLWSYYKKHGLDETPQVAYVKPMFVVKITLTDFFKKDMLTWKIVNGKRIETGTAPAITMRHPRLAGIREDKSVSPQDAGLQQLHILKGEE